MSYTPLNVVIKQLKNDCQMYTFNNSQQVTLFQEVTRPHKSFLRQLS